MNKPIPAAKPCPCCGNTNLHVGIRSAFEHGVKCRYFFEDKKDKDGLGIGGCGLEMTRTVSNVRGVLEELEHAALMDAVKAWNKRSSKKG